MKKSVVGIVAHVDAGKTTLSEAMLYVSGSLREPGSVDKGSAFLDTHELERLRGITIFSKQAQIQYREMKITLLDTPGHVDFSAEMERTLPVLDYTILVINAADGIQAHTRTLWRLLARYEVPVFLFINKMDRPDMDKEALLAALKSSLSSNCVDFGIRQKEVFYEEIALCEESALDIFLNSGSLPEAAVRQLIADRKVFPCFFGSALKLEGVEAFMQGMAQYMVNKEYPPEFGARVFKITRDEQGNRLTHLKLTGGSLKVREIVKGLEEKINQIRIYSGNKYETVNEVIAGDLCAVTGLNVTKAGMFLGVEKANESYFLEPVLTYRILWPQEIDAAVILSKLHLMEEEEPQLHIVWDEQLQEIQAKLMGEVQLEILTGLMQERFGIPIEFGQGNIVYKETIRNTVEGVGHFEPLRHYAEVHLLLEPGERGSGLTFDSRVSEDELDRNWQRLILSHLEEREHRGVLLGAPITDMKITLVAGLAHKKHTEGGDFRQAVYRALRQGLMQAESVLLEPWYEYRLELPEENVGRAMTDIERMSGTFAPPLIEGGMTVLSGMAPVLAMQGYQKELTAYTRGEGRIFLSLAGYFLCHNVGQIIEESGYAPERDLENPSDSVFCAHGAGFIVKWNDVADYMHIESKLPDQDKKEKQTEGRLADKDAASAWIGLEEVDAILERASFANSGNKKKNYTKINSKRELVFDAPSISVKKQPAQERYLLVDGYNIIFAWEALREIAKVSIDGARGRLMDILCNYQSIIKDNLIVVFDAYRVENHSAELFDYYNIHVVYTAEAETADRFIERFAHKNSGRFEITVATSDYMEQIITAGQGCRLFSARELEREVQRVNQENTRAYAESQKGGRSYLLDRFNEEELKRMVKKSTEDKENL